jgi:hypothetical protein
LVTGAAGGIEPGCLLLLVEIVASAGAVTSAGSLPAAAGADAALGCTGDACVLVELGDTVMVSWFEEDVDVDDAGVVVALATATVFSVRFV